MDEKRGKDDRYLRHKKVDTSNLEKLETLDINNINSFYDMTRAQGKTAFGGRAVGDAVNVLVDMVEDKNCFKVLTLSGAMTIGKMNYVIDHMIDNGMVNAVVSTGALMSHGFIESAGYAHYKDPGNITDEELYRQGLNRIYDSLEPETNFEGVDKIICNILNKMDKSRPTCSHELMGELGRYLDEKKEDRSPIKTAFRKGIKIYIPAFTDSEMALDFNLYNRRMRKLGKEEIRFDPFLDFNDIVGDAIKHERWGIFTIGGGVPRNWVQQIAPYLEGLCFQEIHELKNKDFDDKPYDKKFRYGVRICPEPTHWGGLSGCTYSEGISWGKFESIEDGGRYAEVYCDATIAWPWIVKAATELLVKRGKLKYEGSQL
ncbi:MAG: deoxyhypusine synthase family protein [Candidatus Aenigmatarchaeota archaeon]